jgi:hypothetical protein
MLGQMQSLLLLKVLGKGLEAGRKLPPQILEQKFQS